ncbi:MAG: twin-arginine translocase TatA/TatE family subunit [Opitutaceae bacterium]|jgi:sec-independent protein translocase protein TatA
MSSDLFTLAFIEGLGGGEMMLIFFIILLLFGGQRMPELARGLGKSIREFKKATSGVEEQIKKALEEPETPVRTAPKKPRYTPPPAELIEPADADSTATDAGTAKDDSTPPPPEKPGA